MAYPTNKGLLYQHNNEPLPVVGGASATTGFAYSHNGEPFPVMLGAGATTETVTVPLLTITVSGIVPTVTVVTETVTVPLLTITVSGLVPTVNTTIQAITVPLLTISVGGLVPTVLTTSGQSVAVPLLTISVSGLAPTVGVVAVSFRPVVGMSLGIGLGITFVRSGEASVGGGGSTPNDIISPFDVASVIALWENESLGADATGVASWNDSIGTYDLANATGANQPTVDADFFTTAAGTFKGAVFDGTNDLLSSPNLPLSGTDDIMLYIVYADLGDGSARGVVAELGPNYEANTNAFGLTQEIGNWPMLGNRGTSTAQTRKVGRPQKANPTVPKILACRIDRSMKYGTATPFVNGKNESIPITQASITTGNNFGALPLNIGAREGSGANSLWSHIVVLEAAVANTRHVTQTWHGLVSYWGDKFGIDIPPCHGNIVLDGDSWWDAQGTELVTQSDALLRRLDQSAGVWDVVDFSVSGHIYTNALSDVTTQIDPYYWDGKTCILMSDLGENDHELSGDTTATVIASTQTYFSGRKAVGWICGHTDLWYQNGFSWTFARRKTHFDTGIDQFNDFLDTDFLDNGYGDFVIRYRDDPILFCQTVFNDPRSALFDNTHWIRTTHYKIADRERAALEGIGVAFRDITLSTYATPRNVLHADSLSALSDGAAVSSWPNTGSNTTAGVAVSGEEPTYKINQFGTKAGVQFSTTGSGDQITIPGVDRSGSKELTILTVIGYATSTAEQMIYEVGNSVDAITIGATLDSIGPLSMIGRTTGNVGASQSNTPNPYGLHKQPGMAWSRFDRRQSTNQVDVGTNMNTTGTHSINAVNTNAFGVADDHIGMRETGSALKSSYTYGLAVTYDVALELAEIYDLAHYLDGEFSLYLPSYHADLLTDTAGNTLQSHTPQYGTSWAQHPTKATNLIFTDQDRLRNSGGTGTEAIYIAGGVPPHADQIVSATVVMKSSNAESVIGVVARMDPTADTHYRAVYSTVDNKWHLYRRNAGVDTELGTPFAQTLTVDQEYVIGIYIKANFLYLTVDAVSKVGVVTDGSSLAGTGLVGIFASGAATNSTGVHLTHFVATSASWLN